MREPDGCRGDCGERRLISSEPADSLRVSPRRAGHCALPAFRLARGQCLLRAPRFAIPQSSEVVREAREWASVLRKRRHTTSSHLIFTLNLPTMEADCGGPSRGIGSSSPQPISVCGRSGLKASSPGSCQSSRMSRSRTTIGGPTLPQRSGGLRQCHKVGIAVSAPERSSVDFAGPSSDRP